LIFIDTSHSLHYLWQPTKMLAGTKREFTTNAVLATGLPGLLTHTDGKMASLQI